MLFKSREPLSDEVSPQANDSEDAKTPEIATQPEVQTRKASGGDALVGAFEAVGQIVAREMETVKHSISELETRMARRFEAEQATLTSTLGDLRQDVIARIEALRQSQQKAISDLSAQSKASVSGLRGHFEPALEKANHRTEEVKTGLEQILASTEKKLEQELQALTHALSGVRIDLDRQVTASGRVSDLLNNMADLFSDPGSLPEQLSRQASRGEPESSRSGP
jgi:DNA anti-recombination protein RmuC